MAGASADEHYARARALLAGNDLQRALESFQRAFELDPEGRLDRRECLDVFRFLQFQELPSFWYTDLERFFARKDIDLFRYAKAGLNALLAKPPFQRACAAAGSAPQLELSADDVDAIMGDRLLCLLLAGTLVADARFEHLLTRVRRLLLFEAERLTRAPVDFLASLAQQCFLNDYAFAEPAEEAVRIEAELARLDAELQGAPSLGDALTRRMALCAMYRRLDGLAAAGTLERLCQAGPESVKELVRRAVTNVARERTLAAAMPSAAVITDPVSRQVRAQYEANPYPRWLALNRLPPVTAAEWVAQDAPVPAVRLPANPRVLVAGCGTGAEAISIASWMRDARVTAVDLSRASLAYAARMAGELGTSNVEFLQCDILSLDTLGQEFDLVFCTGVLHHMREPAAGLRSLRTTVRPGALLRLGFYTRRGRSDVNAARDLIRGRGLEATESAIRAFRQEVLGCAKDSPMRGLLASRDFFSLSECRDLLFHVQEHQFDPAALAEMIRAERLEILGLSKNMPATCALAYQRTFPGETPGKDLGKWDAVESRFPEIFRGMVLVWCRTPDTYNDAP